MLLARGELEAAAQYNHWAREIHAELRSEVSLVMDALHAGLIAAHRGLLEDAEEHLVEALRRGREVDHPYARAASLAWLGNVAASREDWAGAAGRYGSASAAFGAMGRPVGRAIFAAMAAFAAIVQGDRPATAGGLTEAGRALAGRGAAAEVVGAVCVGFEALLEGRVADARAALDALDLGGDYRGVKLTRLEIELAARMLQTAVEA